MSSRTFQSPTTPTFGALLRQFRTAAGLTQEALAEQAGLSVRGISDLERELNRHPRRDTLEMILGALSLSAADETELRAAAFRPLPVAEPAEALNGVVLPAPPTPLIGREREISELAAVLGNPATRWVTLTGPGGVGKSTLAAAVARNLANSAYDVVTWVELAPIRDADLVLPAVAQAMGLPDDPETPVASQLTRAIADRRALLVVDNLEQVVDSASALAQLLDRCANLQFLATSRVRLRVRAEQVVAVSPLNIPPEEPPEASLDALAQTSAVALFVARSARVRPGFALERANAAAVAGICRRLDGLPLAIELAAARSALLDPASLLRRLDHRLALLTQGFRDAPDRQRTMRDAIAWSHDLLPPAAQVLFRRLAIFTGGFDLGAAAGVTSIVESQASSPNWRTLAEIPPGPDLIEALQVLLDASLIQRHDHEDGHQRYRMLETVREFAAEQLGLRNETTTVRNAHAAYFAAVSSERIRYPDILGEAPSFLSRVEAEIGNVRSALEWVARERQVAAGLALAQGLGLVAFFRGHMTEALTWLDHFLATDDDVPVDLLFRARMARSIVRFGLGMEREAVADANEALALVGSDDIISRAAATSMRGMAARSKVDFEAALALTRDRTDGAIVASSVFVGLSLLESTIDNDAGQAMAHLEAAIALQGPAPTVGRSISIGNLATLVLQGGDIRRAAALRRESLLLNRQGRSTHNFVIGLLSTAEIAFPAGLPTTAARLVGAAQSLQERIQGVELWFNAGTVEDQMNALRTALGEEAVGAALAAGRALRLDDALDEALHVLEHIGGSPS